MRKKITDEALIAFVRWCRMNPAHIVEDPAVARRVFDAYRLLPSDKPKETS